MLVYYITESIQRYFTTSKVAGANRPPKEELNQIARKRTRYSKFFMDTATLSNLQILRHIIYDRSLTERQKLKKIADKLAVVCNKTYVIEPAHYGHRDGVEGLFDDDGNAIELGYESHSGVAGIDNSDVSDAVQTDSGAANTTFSTDVSMNMFEAKSASDPLRNDIHQPDVDLTTFLKRPIKILSQTWAVGDFLRLTIDPWTLFLQHPAIARKLYNYAYLSGSMTITLMINGTQFHFGKGLLSYNPRNAGTIPARAPGSAPVIDNIIYSQRPHIMFDPSESVGGVLSLPFVNPLNMLDITDPTLVSSMGSLTLSSFNQLQHALAVADPITVTIFARMNDDVVLAGSTNAAPANFVSQSGMTMKKNDEYGQGVISRPASALAKVAGMLTKVPVIGHWAFATQIGAQATSQIASLFGWSRPINLNPINKVRPTYVGNMANTSIDDATDKLSFDPKQEITVDPRTIGYGDGNDDLVIQSIATRPSYLTRFQWLPAYNVGKHLFSARVTPMMFTRQNVSGTTEIGPTPMAFAAYPFRHWRGSIVYRFQVVASKFHKGRLRIHYDPLGIAPGEPDWAGGYNEVFDISDTRDLEVKIGWNQAAAYRFVGNQWSNIFTPINHTPRDGDLSPVNPIGDLPLNTNGVIAVYVLNELAAPETTGDASNVEVNVFVSACDDFEVAGPESLGLDSLSVHSEQFVSQSGEVCIESTAPTGSSTIPRTTMGAESSPRNIDNALYFGEAFTSFRDMLKRYAYYTTYGNPLSDEDARSYALNITHKVFPPYRGNDGTVQVYAKNTLLHYLTPAFVARRGGIRWKYVYNDLSANITCDNRNLIVRRITQDSLVSSSVLVPLTLNGGTDSMDLTRRVTSHIDTWNGAQSTNVGQCPSLEVEFPYYREERYTDASLVAENVLETDFSQLNLLIPAVRNNKSPPANEHTFDAYLAPGEDFNLMWFLSCPILYFVPEQTL